MSTRIFQKRQKMRLSGLRSLFKTSLVKYAVSDCTNLGCVRSSSLISAGESVGRTHSSGDYSTVPDADDVIDRGARKMELAKNLASLVEESIAADMRRPKSRMELKRSFELRIKKKVKAQHINGKFQDLFEKVIAHPTTLLEAYNCVRFNSNVGVASEDETVLFESMAKELYYGTFDVNANTFSISTKGSSKELLVLPNLKLRVLQEAIRIVLEVVHKPHFSKISHGCRSGRGHRTALNYIRKEISDPDWWFTVRINKKMDARILAKLISLMEEKIEDRKLFGIIGSMFEAEVLNLEFGGFPKGHGLPQEGVLSPILMNIYLNPFDSEFYRLSMKYEALDESCRSYGDASHSKLRSWFRRQLPGSDHNSTTEGRFRVRVHCCRFMDEIFLAVTGPKEVAVGFKSEILDYLQGSLHLNIHNPEELISCREPDAVRFVGTIIRRSVKESPAVKAVHKLKEKVKSLTLQKQDAWDDLTVRIGKKWLAHGLKKVKESEIKALADPSSTLSQISSYRKPGMETDHWYKVLLKTWMQDVNAGAAESEEMILSKNIVEPSLPQELRDSFYELQRCAEDYISAETATILSLLPHSKSSTDSISFTEIIAPINSIRKRLMRYGLTTSKGYPRSSSLLVLQDNTQIVDWFKGIACRWLKWYADCDNFGEVKLLICNEVRKSCIRTLATKHRIHENEIEKKFDTELSRIPSTEEIEQEDDYAAAESSAFDNDEALTYGISYSGSCVLSLARVVSHSRPCSCFIYGCSASAQSVYSLHVMERQKFPGWKTGFSSCIHPSLNGRRIGLCKQHLKDLYLGHISLQSVNFDAWH